MSGAMTPTEALTLWKRVAVEEPEIRQMFNSGTPLHDLVDSGSEVTDAVSMIGRKEGEYMYFMAEVSPAGNKATGMAYGDSFPAGGVAEYARLRYVNRDVSSVDAFNMFVMDRSQGGESSYDELMSLQMDSTINRNRSVMDRMLHGDGTGKMALCATNGWTDATQKLAVDDVSAFTKYDEIILRLPTSGGFRTGTRVSDFPQTPTGRAAPFRVTAVDKVNKTLTLINSATGGAVKEDDGDALSASDVDGMAVYRYDAQGKDVWGLKNFCRPGNPAYSGFNPSSPGSALTTDELRTEGLFGGLDRTDASNEYFVPISIDAQNSTISVEDHIYGFLRQVEDRCGEDDMPMLIGLTGREVRDKIASELNRANRTNFETRLRAPGDKAKKKRSYRAVRVDNLYIIASQNADPTAIDIFAPSHAFRTIPVPWMIDETGTSDGLRILTDDLGRAKPEWDMRWRTRQQFMAGTCRANGSITGLLATI